LHGIGYLAAGAKSYLGIDPIVRLDRDRVKNLTTKTKENFGWSPAEISEMVVNWHASPQAIEDLPEDKCFDLATLHNVTEHLHQIEDVFREVAIRLRPGGKILYNHHNFYCWNGHHLRPKVVTDIDTSDPTQVDILDWSHIEYEPAPEHYIARGLNKIRLDDIVELTKRYFIIETMEEILSKPETGLGRLTAETRERYPYLQQRDFETQNLYCIARVKD
jgi:SAM-dependent methyltransferase